MDREYLSRIENLQKYLLENEIGGAIITASPNQIYFAGAVFCGYLYIPASGDAKKFVKQGGYETEGAILYKSPKQLPELFSGAGVDVPGTLMVEDGDISASEYLMLSKIFADSKLICGSNAFRQLRSVKTDWELEIIKKTCKVHAEAYRKIRAIYKSGMTDLEFSGAIEYQLRKLGHQGIFRTYGFRMEAFMGSVLAGDNAAVPSPYDFSLGGAGSHPSMPLGACGRIMESGESVMVDLSNNLYGYISDMSRAFSIGKLSQEAYAAHRVSIDIQSRIAREAKPGTVCSELYDMAVDMADKAGLSNCFMGREHKAKFVGHGLGIEINEPPVLAPRMTTQLEENMVIALEPKFIIDGVGAVGTENTYVVTKDGLEKLTLFEEEIIDLCI